MIDGLKIVKVIHSTDRFEAYEAEYKGQKAFAKKAKTDKTRELLAGLPKNSEIVNDLGRKTDFQFRAPQIYQHEEDWIVTEWINGVSLGSSVVSQPDYVADILSSFFSVFDEEVVVDEGFRQIFTKTGLASRMAERLPTSLSVEQKRTLTAAKNLFDSLHPTLVPALQDADIKPDHIFADPKNSGAYVLVDSEHLSNQWPRFFDLGNNIVKFWIRGQKEFSNILLKTFLAKSQISKENIFQPLLGTMIVRGIALHWEPDYDPGAESYNIPRAQEMLKACLAASNLEDLLY